MNQDIDYMLKSIGMFEIDKDITKKYNEYILKSVNDKESLNFLDTNVGIKKMFKGEMFYQAADGVDNFLGRIASFNLIGTIDNKIYKIYFKFFDDNQSECMSFRNEIREHFSEYMSSQEFTNVQITKIKYGRNAIWTFDWGNILIEEMDMITEAESVWSTAVAITSKAVGSAQKLGFFDKLFNRS